MQYPSDDPKKHICRVLGKESVLQTVYQALKPLALPISSPQSVQITFAGRLSHRTVFSLPVKQRYENRRAHHAGG